MTRVVRAAMAETVNAYKEMPAHVSDLHELEGRLGDIRRANVDHHLDLLASAAADGVKVIGFGELFPAPYFALGGDPIWTALAEVIDESETVASIRVAAKQYGVIVVAPIYERDDKTGKRFNTAVVIDEHGAIVGTFRKAHIPYGKNEQGSFHENLFYERSDGDNRLGSANVSDNPFFPVFETSVGRIGVAICYDRHFEGVMASLAKAGAELVFSPAVTFGQKSQRMWRLEFAVDAARHNVFIGGSNRKGVEPPWNQPYFGDSHFVGPSGVVSTRPSRPELVVADLDLGELSRPDPAGWNLPRDTRPDIYSQRK